MTNRAQYIQEHYRLEQTADGWLATSEHGGIDPQTGKPWHSLSTIAGPSRADVVYRARCQWGHFNFDDEAQAFTEIFTP